MTKLQEIPVGAIREVESLQVRKFYDKERLEELAHSLAEIGVLQPVIVRPSAKQKNSYELIAGSRRLRAAKQANVATIPACIVKSADDGKALQIAVTENLQRSDLTPFEEGFALAKLMKAMDLSSSAAAKMIGRSTAYIESRLKLLQLPPELQQLAVEKKLSMGHAGVLARAASAEEQRELADTALNNNLSSDELRTYAKKKRGTRGRKQADDKEQRNQGLTPKRVELRIEEFMQYLKTALPVIIEGSGGEINNVRVSLVELKREVENALQYIVERAA